MEITGELAAVKPEKTGAIKKYYWLKAFIIALLMGIAAIIPHIIAGNGIFILSNDYGGLFVPQNILISDTLKSGNLFWNWSLDLGGNFMESLGVGNIYTLILALFPSALVPFLMPWMTVLKIAVSALTASLYLKRHLKRDINVIICSLLYAFSGFQIASIMYYIFADFISVFPLMLFGLELLAEEKKHGVLLLACFLNIIMGGIAIFYGEVLFLVIYFIIKYFNLAMLKDVKVFTGKLKNILFCIIEGVLGMLCAGITVLPSLMNLLGNSRISQHIATESYLSFTTVNWLQVIKAFLLPAEPMNHNFTLEPFNWYSNAVYLPVVGMVLVVAYLLKKHDWKSRLVKLFLIVSVVPLFSSAFMAFSYEPYRRWYYMFSLILVLVTGCVLEEYQKYPVYKSSVINFAILLVYYWLTFACLWQGDLGNMVLQRELFFVNLLIALAGIAICVICYWKKLKKTLPIILSAVIVYGTGLTSSLLLEHHYTVNSVHAFDSYEFDSFDKSYYENVYAFIFETVEDLSPDILPYRYSFEDYSGYSYYDFAMVKGLPSINSFLTTAHGSVTDFYDSISVGRKNMTAEIDFTGKTLLGAKYIVSTAKKNDENIKFIEKKTLSSGQEIYFYENEYALPIGFTQDKYLRKSEFDLLGQEYKTAAMINALVIDDEDEAAVSKILPHQENCVYADLSENIKDVFEEKKKESTIDFTVEDNYFSATVKTEKERYMFFTVPYDKNWSATVNGKEAEIIKSNGLMAVPVPEGESKVEFRFDYPLFKYAVIISAAGIALSAVYVFVCLAVRKKRKSSGETDGGSETQSPEDNLASAGQTEQAKSEPASQSDNVQPASEQQPTNESNGQEPPQNSAVQK